jgi:spore coat protein JB
MDHSMYNQYDLLLKKIQAIDFMLTELSLYLDTHPHDMEAVEQYNQYSHKRELLKSDFETAFGPLLQFGSPYAAQLSREREWASPWQVS